MSAKVSYPSLDIWQTQNIIKVNCNKVKVIIKKNNFLFLVKVDGEYLFFKTEENTMCKIHKSIIDSNQIKKVF